MLNASAKVFIAAHEAVSSVGPVDKSRLSLLSLGVLLLLFLAVTAQAGVLALDGKVLWNRGLGYQYLSDLAVSSNSEYVAALEYPSADP